jgi:hypothetical protein
MATPAKRAAPARAKPAPKPVAPIVSPSKPFLRFYHSEALRARTLKVLETVENCPDPTAHCNALTDLILELVDSGMDYYFLRSLKATKAGFVAQQSASLGLVGVQKVMGTVIRNVLGRMSGPQLLSVCGTVRELME